MKKTPSVNYIQAIEQELNEKEFRYGKQQHDGITAFFVYLHGSRSFLDVQLIIEENENDVKIRCYPVKKTSQDRRAAILEAMNKFNSEYRYVSLSLDGDGDICASYDFEIHTMDEKEAAVYCVKTIVLVAKIIDDGYAKIMKVVWGGDDEESTGLEYYDDDGLDCKEDANDVDYDLQEFDDMFQEFIDTDDDGDDENNDAD